MRPTRNTPTQRVAAVRVVSIDFRAAAVAGFVRTGSVVACTAVEMGAAVDDESLGAWSPMTVTETSAVFGAAPFRWYIAGGHALELAVGRSWRDHADSTWGSAAET